MKIAEGLDVLELGSEERRMNATLIWDDKNVILIDAGLPGQLENIREEVEKAGVSFDRINKIIITHHDLDHIGSLSSIVKNSKSEIEVLAHSGERPYIEGDKIGIKITPERLSSMPESMKETIKQLKTKVNRVVKDEEELSYCGGIEVIYTPGHTPGHICLYLKKYKALVTGDAMNVVNDELIGPNPEYTFDMKQAIESLKKLTKYDIETVICYHGGVFTRSSNDRIAKLANS
ncbi:MULTISPECIES: MBL fold metallo-hydrolase [Clostridium]|uniref:MBL fold metallo-hydrolase n=1 Tax=Clostridium beijerinckii TaxID=1520 RepID=A0A1S9MZU9_CLOBE|nr:MULTISPECIES: MBL fold metallo-hydrolase [Clostridium]MBN7576111.1 MBL fold metallo-hydrolase [Clostridium beijerinckii]MBN7581821.1 MBL fold metallo-hydrolase [Clostridium beijerinckii]MBN7585883.1 MBL fold metallo-hydrolase [Clostridium beijerinckii]MBO0521793.1 MBL fold metallo-hydrolase [Clostridium beijerinckii]MZK53988.1 MBL fold metallo-hydrolase [Clostridium beijerinckii]